MDAYSDIPTPKYRRGQTVFYAAAESTTETLPCPDCLGSRTWKVVTPAGAELEAECQRCQRHGSFRDLPSLARQTWLPSVSRRTIGSIQIDTEGGKDGWGAPVRYMCSETGISSGSVYNEDKLFPDEESARAEAERLVRQHKVAADAMPERIEQARLAYLTLRDATLEQARSAVWNSWYRYRNLRESIEGLLEGDGSTAAAGLKEAVESELDFDLRYRSGAHPFDAVLEAAAKVVEATGDEALAAALNDLPFKPLAPKPEPEVMC